MFECCSHATDTRQPLDRRRFLKLTALATTGILLASHDSGAETDFSDSITEIIGADYQPGLAVCRIQAGRVTGSAGFGWADLEKQVAMTTDTIMNIASVSKTITATAVMQLHESGALDLDRSVDEYLPFLVRNPGFPDSIITCRQLLAHRSSIKDGPAYGAGYSCGDPTVNLADWLAGYLQTDGEYFDLEGNFHTWEPGTIEPPAQPRAYSNVGYGLLAYIVELVSGTPFTRYTIEKIFAPLGMQDSGWYLTEIDRSRHAVTYTSIGPDFELPPQCPDLQSFLPRFNNPESAAQADLFPH